MYRMKSFPGYLLLTHPARLAGQLPAPSFRIATGPRIGRLPQAACSQTRRSYSQPVSPPAGNSWVAEGLLALLDEFWLAAYCGYLLLHPLAALRELLSVAQPPLESLSVRCKTPR